MTSPKTAEDFYQLGLKHENFDNRSRALESYHKALNQDDQHGQAHFQLGLMLLRSADFDGAGDHLQRAANLGISSAGYYLGLKAWYGGDAVAADRHYRSVPENDPLWFATQRGLACVALRRKDWEQAVDLLHTRETEQIEGFSLASLSALAYRCAGQTGDAKEQWKQILSSDPLNLQALRELSILDVEQGRYTPLD
jgi:tetratricopeptide (TPR) repeat protein